MEREWNGEVANVWQLATATVCALLIFANCSVPKLPLDFNAATIDPQIAIAYADVVVLGYAVDQKSVRMFYAVDSHCHKLHLREVRTTLRVIDAIKGLSATQHYERIKELMFDHYEVEGDPGTAGLTGPSQGSSGGIGVKGIFFLRRKAGPVYRSFVDVYRPDIPTPWIRDHSIVPNCPNPALCTSELLLNFSPGDDPSSFEYHTTTNVGIASELVGYTTTLRLLEMMITSSGNPSISLKGCTEMALSFPLEMTHTCASLISSREEGKHWSEVLHANKEQLRQKGLVWLVNRVHPKDDAQFAEYLTYLSNSADSSVAEFAAHWMTILHLHLSAIHR